MRAKSELKCTIICVLDIYLRKGKVLIKHSLHGKNRSLVFLSFSSMEMKNKMTFRVNLMLLLFYELMINV